MTSESAEVRSPAPSVDRCQTWGYYTGRQCSEPKGHEGRHITEPAVGRYSAPSVDTPDTAFNRGYLLGFDHGRAAAPSLREALIAAERALRQDLRQQYPESCLWMDGIEEHVDGLLSRAALASSDPGSPSNGGLDVERLADALRDSGVGEHYDGSPWNPTTLRISAEALAAEYARLSGSPSESEG